MVHGIRTPIPVRCLELIQQHKRLVAFTRTQPVDAIVLDDLRRMAGGLGDRIRAIYAKLGIEIRPLSAPINQHLRIIKAGGRRSQMPLSNDSRLVSIRLKNLGKGHLFSIEVATVYILIETVDVREFPRQNRRPTWTANRVGAINCIHSGAIFGNAVDVRRRSQFADFRSVGTDGLVSQIICHDIDHIERLGCGLLFGALRGA